MRTNGLFRYLGFITLMLASMSVASQAFALEDRAWNVESHAGTVWVTQAALQPVALNPNESLRAGSTIETGDDGRVILVRGDESIIVSPRTSLALPEHNDNGMATTILQSFGTILLQVEKRAKQHFEVETPFLAAVVKGTKFTVTVDQSGAAVHVVEGAVEVIDLDTGDVGMVRPGQTAHTPAAQGVGLSVGGPGAAAPARGAAPARVNKAIPAPRQTQASAPIKAPAPIIVASVGTAALDVGMSTNGLARGATVSNGRVSSASSNADTSNSAMRTGATSENTVGTAGASGNIPAGLVGNTNAVAAGLSERGSDTSGNSGAATAALSSSSAPGLTDNPNSNAGGNSAAAASNGLAVGNTGATPPGLAQTSASNAGGNGNGVAVGLTNSTPPGLTNNPSANTGNTGNGLAVGQTGATPPGLANNPNANAGGNGNGLAVGQTGATPPGLENNPNSNAGGNGNGNGNANSNAGGNGKGNGKV
ncbi:MAG: FecR family protein [Parvibaculaceae bacterium]|nr:FecR family protein [Parvibaculaceae bacterium]HBM88372.1 hypothetical protein [Rhodobiaceae bacterium]|tara:strand:+ start:2173 stop:3609 length:1437 start_codon:yes stop_codon:yes gene_type:complete